MSIALIVVAMLGINAVAALAADNYKVDPAHSMIVFRINHMNTSNVYGRFNGVAGTLVVEGDEPVSFDAQVQTKNVDTAVEARDKHLRSDTFFNAEEFPTISFKSKSVKKTGDKTYEVTGDLALHGVTKSITVSIDRIGSSDSPQMGHRIGFETVFSIKRSDYGMTNMVGPVGDEVKLMVNLEAQKQ